MCRTVFLSAQVPRRPRFVRELRARIQDFAREPAQGTKEPQLGSACPFPSARERVQFVRGAYARRPRHRGSQFGPPDSSRLLPAKLRSFPHSLKKRVNLRGPDRRISRVEILKRTP